MNEYHQLAGYFGLFDGANLETNGGWIDRHCSATNRNNKSIELFRNGTIIQMRRRIVSSRAYSAVCPMKSARTNTIFLLILVLFFQSNFAHASVFSSVKQDCVHRIIETRWEQNVVWPAACLMTKRPRVSQPRQCRDWLCFGLIRYSRVSTDIGEWCIKFHERHNNDWKITKRGDFQQEIPNLRNSYSKTTRKTSLTHHQLHL